MVQRTLCGDVLWGNAQAQGAFDFLQSPWLKLEFGVREDKWWRHRLPKEFGGKCIIINSRISGMATQQNLTSLTIHSPWHERKSFELHKSSLCHMYQTERALFLLVSKAGMRPRMVWINFTFTWKFACQVSSQDVDKLRFRSWWERMRNHSWGYPVQAPAPRRSPHISHWGAASHGIKSHSALVPFSFRNPSLEWWPAAPKIGNV